MGITLLVAVAVFVASLAGRATAAPPANDLIENATPITALPFTATQDNTEATVSPTDPPPACGHGLATFSVWYSYTALTDGLIKVSPSGSGFSVPTATIYQGSPGSLTQVGCRGDVVAVTAGTTYYIRLSLPGCCPGTFTLDVTVPTPPANDLIENATPITTLPFTATQDNTDATVSPTDPPPACGHGLATSSVWYSYTALTDGLIKVSPSGSGFSVPTATIYQGSPGSLTQIGCRGDVVAVTAGTTYYIRLSLPGCCPGTFTLDVTVPTPPANDLIENATPITTLPFTATQNSTDGTLSATDPPSSCGFVSQYTLWYSYTAPADGLIKIRTSSTDLFATPRVTVYQGSPGSLTQVSCNQIVRVTAGTSYYLMLTVPGCCFGTFTLDVTVPTPPTNDLIENATPITALPFTATQDSTDATVSPTDPPSSCNSSPTYTLWYSYTAPADGLLRIGPSSNAVTLYRGPLGSLTEVGCGGQAGQFLPVTAGTSYYLMVSSCCFGPFTLDISIPNPPPNDLIDNATPITALPFTATQASVDATRSPTDPSSTCIGGAVPTVWYSFAATTDGLIQALTTGGFSTYITVYQGRPGSLSQVACTFGGQSLPVPVTKGATYYLSVVALLHDTFTLNVTGLLTISLPGDMTLEATSPLGATVNYMATASLPDGSPAPIDCSPPTGATVPLGDTTITCTASDNSGHTLTRGFVVHVVDTVSPTLTVPASITTNATGPGGASVSYAVSASDTADPNPTVACDPPSESLFTVGDTTVRCIATDLAGNSSDPASFVVHVKGAPEQLRDLSDAVAALPGAESLRHSLQVKLRDAENALSAGKQASACGSLNDFIGAVNARSGKSIAAATAQVLVADATRIKTVIECRR